MVTCLFCKSSHIEKKVQIFKNNSKHLYIRCFDCKKVFYAPKIFITPDLQEFKSKKTLRAEAQLALSMPVISND